MTLIEQVELTVAILGTCATTVAAIAAWFSANAASKSAELSKDMLIKQTEDSINDARPTLLILEKNVDIEFESKYDIPHLYNWDTQTFDLEDRLFSKQVEMELVNLGRGFAKEIICEWKIEDIDKFLDEIHSIGHTINRFYKEFNVVCENKEKSLDKILRVYSENNKYKGIDDFLIYNIQQNINFLQTNTSTQIALPKIYVVLYNILIGNYPVKSTTVVNHPTLELKLKFKDVDDREYEDIYKIRLTQLNSGFKDMIIYGKLKINAKKCNMDN